MRTALAVILALIAAAPAAAADQFYREELRIPFAAAGARGLEALPIRPSGTQRYPLALLSHGAPRDGLERTGMTPNGFYAQAIEFARRGFAAVVLMRRGYANSGGSYAESSGPCASRNYLAAATASAADLRAAVDAISHRTDVTTQGMIAVGRSAGGFASIALSADPPPGLAAVISFAGGRGSRADDECATRPRWFAPSLPWARRRGFRCCGSTQPTTSSSGPNWRTGSMPPSLRPVAVPASSTHPRSAPTATRCFLQPEPRSGPRWSMVFLREQNLGNRELIATPPRRACPAPAAERKGPRQFRRLPRQRPAQGFCGIAEGPFRLSQRTSNVGPGRGRGSCRLRKICAGLRAVCDRR